MNHSPNCSSHVLSSSERVDALFARVSADKIRGITPNIPLYAHVLDLHSSDHDRDCPYCDHVQNIVHDSFQPNQPDLSNQLFQ